MIDEYMALDPDVRAVLEPVESVLDLATDKIPTSPPLRVRFGEVDGYYHLDGRELVLSHHLAGPGLHHPNESVAAMPTARVATTAAVKAALRRRTRKASRRSVRSVSMTTYYGWWRPGFAAAGPLTPH